MYIYTEDDDRWMEAERAARERIQDVNDKIQKARIEVASEIFEEIEKYWIDSDTLPDCARLVDLDKIAELKKKYTEEQI